MEIFRFNILPGTEILQKEAIKQSLLNCQICGTELNFSHQKNTGGDLVQEEGHCPACQIRMHKKTYRLQ